MLIVQQTIAAKQLIALVRQDGAGYVERFWQFCSLSSRVEECFDMITQQRCELHVSVSMQLLKSVSQYDNVTTTTLFVCNATELDPIAVSVVVQTSVMCIVAMW